MTATEPQWHPVARSDDLGPGQARGVDFHDDRIVVWRTESGTVRAAQRWCPHLGSDLTRRSEVAGEWLRCTVHDWCFDTTGACVEVPLAGMAIPDDVHLTTHLTEDAWGWIWVRDEG